MNDGPMSGGTKMAYGAASVGVVALALWLGYITGGPAEDDTPAETAPKKVTDAPAEKPAPSDGVRPTDDKAAKVDDEPLRGWQPRETNALGRGKVLEIPSDVGAVSGRFWAARQTDRPLVVVTGDERMETAVWQPYVEALDEVMDVNVLAIRSAAGGDDLKAAIRLMKGKLGAELPVVVVAADDGFDRALSQLADRDGLIVVGVSPRLISAAAKAAWQSPALPWSLCLVGQQHLEEDRRILEGARPETMATRILLSRDDDADMKLLWSSDVSASAMGWLFGLLGGND